MPSRLSFGGAMRADSFAGGGMAGAENAWDESGGHDNGGKLPRLLAQGLAHSSIDASRLIRAVASPEALGHHRILPCNCRD